MSAGVFFRVLLDEEKSQALEQAIRDTREGHTFTSTTHVANSSSFSQIPGSTFAYWVSEQVRHIFTDFSPLEGNGRTVKQGLATADDFRFLRLHWEVSPNETILTTLETSYEEILQQTFRSKYWIPFAKGGSYAPYYSDLHLVVNWKQDAEELKNFKDPQTGKPFAYLRNPSFYFRPGLTWPLRTQRGLSVRVYPIGCIFSHKGPTIISTIETLPFLLGLSNSIVFQALVSLQMAFGSYEVGVIQRTPIPNLSGNDSLTLGNLALLCVDIKRNLDRVNETSHIFYLPALLSSQGHTLRERLLAWQQRVHCAKQHLTEYQQAIDDLSFHLYSIEGADRQAIGESLRNAKSGTDKEEDDEESTDEAGTNPVSLILDILSYTLGISFGRWDIRFALGESLEPELPDPFAPLPVCSPGMLLGKDGLPLLESPSVYPIDIKWDGILVDDPDHPDDLIRHTQKILSVIWKDNAESIEQEICQILSIKDLREYFRRPGKGGFWADHIQRYSMSRRKAPIYWLLQSAKRNYALWLYYYRLDKDLLFKALVNYVEPKLRLEESRLEQLRAQKEGGALVGREARQLERQLERQESLLSEMNDFRDKLRCVADFGLEPDLNDGVVLNIAPLWELVPWNEAKKYWEELSTGKYEWSSISKQLHAKRMVKPRI